MISRAFNITAAVVLAVLVPILLVACGGGDTGLSRAEVEEIVRAELASVPEPAAPEPGLTSAEAEQMVQATIAGMPEPEPGLTSAEAEQIARSVVASIPPRSAPAAYTKFFVDNAIVRYRTEGLDATLTHYNSADSVDGQWYVFIIDENDTVIGHPDVQRLGLDVKGWVGTDANGYNFGPDMLSATEEGKWVSYVFRNPESGSLGSDHSGELELKNVWVVRRDGLLFCSGWYINADEFTKALVATAAHVFRQVGLEGTIAYFASPEIDFGGLRAAITYYNSADNVEGDWFAFIADESGTIIDHYHKEMVGKSLEDVLGTDTFEATAEGNWVTTESLRVWVVSQDGMTFGSGWHHAEPSFQGSGETGDAIADEIIRAIKLQDWEYADAPLALDWSQAIGPAVMERVIQWWYEDRNVHRYLEFDCEDKSFSQQETPLILTYSCYGTQDTLGDEIVTFGQVRHVPSDKTMYIQHEFAHQTDFQTPARYVRFTTTIGEDAKTSTYEDVRRQGGFDKVEASREEWKSLGSDASSPGGSLDVIQISDTSALIVMDDAPEGSAYQWAESPCRPIPDDGRYQLLGLAPGTQYTVRLYSDETCEDPLGSLTFETLVR